MYDLGDDLLMVASDRISTYDVVHPTPIPDKGSVLTGLSVLWFDLTGDDRPQPLRLGHRRRAGGPARPRAARPAAGDAARRVRRARLHHRARAGRTTSAPARSRASQLPEGLQESEQLPEPIFTPSTKAEEGHDEAIDFDQAAELVGDRALAERLRDVSLAVYGAIAEHARERGVILADTKFEFGLDADGELVLGDEVCTPDSSRFWPADDYEPGRGQPSFDKQYVRDWAAGTGWDKSPPAPAIPDDVVAATRERYVTAYEQLAGEPFSALAGARGRPE